MPTVLDAQRRLIPTDSGGTLELMILSVLSAEEPISVACRASKSATRKRRGPLNPSVERDESHQIQVI
jgi:hypothetical protein